MLALTKEQLVETISHLYEALEGLKSVGREIESGAMRGIEISEKLAEAWFKVNCCRLYIQEDVNLEDLNLEAMGLINDAKCMMESLIKWRKGMTLSGKLCIMDSISSAAGNVYLVVCELERWLSQVAEETSPDVL
jgi:hypothetical protein